MDPTELAGPTQVRNGKAYLRIDGRVGVLAAPSFSFR